MKASQLKLINSFFVFFALITIAATAQTPETSHSGTITLKKKSIFVFTELSCIETMDGVPVIRGKGASRLTMQALTSLKGEKVIDLDDYFKTNLAFKYPDTLKTLRVDTVIISFSIMGNGLGEVGSSVCRTADKFLGAKRGNDLGLECYKVMNTLQYWKVKDSNALVNANCRLKVYISNYMFKE